LIFGIDISNWQGNFDVAAAAREGYEFAIAKCSEGMGYDDPYFNRNVGKARQAGMAPGAYHWLKNGSGAAQAEKFFHRCSYLGLDDLVTVCDNESDANWATTVDFFKRWNQLAEGHPMVMYTGGWWWTPRGWDGASLTPYLWASRYVSGTGYGSTLYQQVPDYFWRPGYGGWNSATILQFSSRGRVAGQRIDVNAFRGTKEQFRSLAGGGYDMSFSEEEKANVFRHMDLIGAAALGRDKTWDDRDVLWVKWLREVWEKVENLSPQQAMLTPEQMEEIKVELQVLTEDIGTGLANEVASILAPRFRVIDQIADRLGAMGDSMAETIGKLNDPPTE
jgi:lysozyme